MPRLGQPFQLAAIRYRRPLAVTPTVSALCDEGGGERRIDVPPPEKAW
jgi:hypothetical protein